MSGQHGDEGTDVRHDAHAAPDHDAVPRGLTGGAEPGPVGHGRRKRRGGGRGGEELMVPEAEFTSYYGRPILHKPKWEPLDIAGYLFLGGLAGSSSVLAAGATATGRPALARTCKVGSLVSEPGLFGKTLERNAQPVAQPCRGWRVPGSNVAEDFADVLPCPERDGIASQRGRP